MREDGRARGLSALASPRTPLDPAMLTGVALPLSQSLLDLIVPHNIGPRVHARDGKLELQFLFRHAERVLPFLQDGQLRIARWATGAARAAIDPAPAGRGARPSRPVARCFPPRTVCDERSIPKSDHSRTQTEATSLTAFYTLFYNQRGLPRKRRWV